MNRRVLVQNEQSKRCIQGEGTRGQGVADWWARFICQDDLTVTSIIGLGSGLPGAEFPGRGDTLCQCTAHHCPRPGEAQEMPSRSEGQTAGLGQQPQLLFIRMGHPQTRSCRVRNASPTSGRLRSWCKWETSLSSECVQPFLKFIFKKKAVLFHLGYKTLYKMGVLSASLCVPGQQQCPWET